MPRESKLAALRAVGWVGTLFFTVYFHKQGYGMEAIALALCAYALGQYHGRMDSEEEK